MIARKLCRRAPCRACYDNLERLKQENTSEERVRLQGLQEEASVRESLFCQSLQLNVSGRKSPVESLRQKVSDPELLFKAFQCKTFSVKPLALFNEESSPLGSCQSLNRLKFLATLAAKPLNSKVSKLRLWNSRQEILYRRASVIQSGCVEPEIRRILRSRKSFFFTEKCFSERTVCKQFLLRKVQEESAIFLLASFGRANNFQRTIKFLISKFVPA